MATDRSERERVAWTLVSPEEPLFYSWDDELAVVYSGASGDTHLVSALAVEVLRLLETGPRTPEMVYEHLADAFRDHDAGAALDIIWEVLSQLQDIQLVSAHQN